MCPVVEHALLLRRQRAEVRLCVGGVGVRVLGEGGYSKVEGGSIASKPSPGLSTATCLCGLHASVKGAQGEALAHFVLGL